MLIQIMDMGPDVKGDCSLPGFQNKIELLAYSHGVAMQITGDISSRERVSGKPNHVDMSVTKHLDAASPVLNQACCEGKSFPKVDIIVGSDDGGKMVELMRYTISNVIISSISVSGGGGDKPVENVTLNYNKIIWRYTPQKPVAGEAKAIEGTWDLAKNAAK